MTKAPKPTKTKGLPRDMNLRARRLLKEKLEQDYGDLTKNGWQAPASEATGLSRSELSEMVRPEDHPSKGFGAPQLVRLSMYLGRTINDILGMDPFPAPMPPRPYPASDQATADFLAEAQAVALSPNVSVLKRAESDGPKRNGRRSKKHLKLHQHSAAETSVERLRQEGGTPRGHHRTSGKGS